MREPGADVVQQSSAHTDALVEQRNAGRRSVCIPEDLEYGERPPQQRIDTGRRLDHHELAGPRERRDLRRGQRDDAVVGRQPRVRDDGRVHVDGHSKSICDTRAKARALHLSLFSFMRFLRMLTNSLLAGALGAAYLTVLVLQLNPQIPLLSDTTWRWFATLALLYGVHLAVTFYVIIVVREFFALRVLSPGWASVRVLAWMAAASAAVAATLMWLNVRGFHTALTEDAAWRMTAGAIATSASAVVLLTIAIAHYSFGRRGSRVGASLFVLAAFASLALPVAARGKAVDLAVPISAVPQSQANPGGGAAGPRVTMLLLDGASFDYVLPRVAEGRLPGFARLLEKAAVMDLATVRPTQPDPVWAAVATGMYPSKNGVRSAASYFARNDDHAVDLLPDHCFSHALVHLGFIRDRPNAATTWRARPLWSIASQSGVRVGVARWPLTYPAEEVDGFIVSDRFHQLVGSIAEFDRAASPRDILPALEASFTESTPDGTPSGRSMGSAESDTPEASALRRDRLYSGAMHDLSAAMITPADRTPVRRSGYGRPLLPPVYPAADVPRRTGRRAAAILAGDRSVLRLHRRRGRRRARRPGARRSPASSFQASACSR